MARTRKVNYTEGDLIRIFGLTPITGQQTAEMQRWLAVQPPELNVVEQGNFDRI